MAKRFDNVYALKKLLKKTKYPNNIVKKGIKKRVSKLKINI
jgi:hypothetical protein